MKLQSPQKEIYSKERFTAQQAQRLAHEISFGPVVFQVSRLMLKFGIFKMLNESKKGLTFAEITKKSGLSKYAVQILLESSLTIGTILLKENYFLLSKVGWFLLNDTMVNVNMNFVHDINYLGMFNLEESLLNERPEGLKVFANCKTLYEILSLLPDQPKKSWFDFDHFYSDNSFEKALEIVFADDPETLLDIGGNTGKWAIQCVTHSKRVHVTIMDLPQQLEMTQQNINGIKGAERIRGFAADILQKNRYIPDNFDVIWMSQFLDCFSENETIDILTSIAKTMRNDSKLYIMELLWDKQRYETASFCITQINHYFTAMANGNSKFFHSDDLKRCIKKAGLFIEETFNDIGLGHTIIKCRKK